MKVDTYVTGGTTDHLTTWRGCADRTAPRPVRLGKSTFVLANTGHIQSLVNPPGNPKAAYFTSPQTGSDPDQWLANATKHTGSWWQEWADWIIAYSGGQRPAPQTLGSPTCQPITAAPGDYVRQPPGA